MKLLHRREAHARPKEREVSMLRKSRKSAFVMGCIYVATALMSYIAMRVVSAPESSIEAILESYVVSDDPTARSIGWPGFLLEITVASWVLSRFIQLGDERHFGWQGALSWAVAGFVYAMWLRSVVYAVSHSGMQGADTVEVLLALLGLIVSCWIPFRRQTRSGSDSREASSESPEVEQAA
jgi:hypothetical protein